jgi:hypothetical protein
MNDVLFGCLLQGGCNLPEHVYRQCGVEPFASPREQLLQVLSRDILLNDVVDAVDATDLVDLHDVGVNQFSGRLRFVVKAADIVLVVSQVALEHFEGDRPAERNLLGQINVGHPTASETAQQLIVPYPSAGKIGNRLSRAAMCRGGRHGEDDQAEERMTEQGRTNAGWTAGWDPHRTVYSVLSTKYAGRPVGGLRNCFVAASGRYKPPGETLSSFSRRAEITGRLTPPARRKFAP